MSNFSSKALTPRELLLHGDYAIHERGTQCRLRDSSVDQVDYHLSLPWDNTLWRARQVSTRSSRRSHTAWPCQKRQFIGDTCGDEKNEVQQVF